MPKVYIGNLANSVTSNDLMVLFSRAGEVRSALAISDKTSGLCRGFGFVDMVDAEDVITAISLLDNAELSGQPIRIAPDRPRDGATEAKTKRRNHRGRNGI